MVRSDERMTIVDHLGELRRRVIISLVAVVIAGVVVYIFSLRIIAFLIQYYEQATDEQRDALIFTGPLDAFATRLKVATYGGFVLALPVWLFQLWRFVTPGLYRNEKRYALSFVASAVLLFVVGGICALIALPRGLDFLLNLGGNELEPLLAADRYLSLVTIMIVAFGLAFQFPVVLVFLLLVRIITTAQLRRWRKIAFVSIPVLAAVITPQDPYSMLMVGIPLYAFYELSILVGRLIRR